MPHIVVKGAVPRFEDFRFNNTIDIDINDGQNFTIIGPNGAGKTQLTDIMLGNIALKEGFSSITSGDKIVPRSKIAFMSFRDIYTMSDTSGIYYQQRWNATENEETPFVRDILKLDKYTNSQELIKNLNIESIVDKRLLFLSSGELRKMQITKALLANPELLVIKNPYIGLDAESRDSVNSLLQNISASRQTQIGLLLSNVRDIPDYIDVAIPVCNKVCFEAISVDSLKNDSALLNRLFPESKFTETSLPQSPLNDANSPYENAIIMHNVNVKYPAKHILKDVNWTVKRGEKWALLGKNGCGKSTLLSLVCGDNPQGYANDITLFDRKRGTGESIWDIKSHIGYLSPDIHTYYQKDIPCINVVASGFFNSIGLYNNPKDEQKQLSLQWMKVFNAEQLANKSFLKISYGEQRLVLLTRVFVKHPSLVILDEPLHGLDEGKKALAKHIIEQYCSDSKITLIYVTHYENEIPSIVDKRKILTKTE